MKKRYLVLIIVLAFGAIFMMLIRDAAAPNIKNSDQFVEDSLIPETPPAQKDDLIVVQSPLPQTSVISPILIKGKARGNWYFEGSFPLTLTDTTGKVLVESYATAQGEWMTTEYVPFSTSLKYTLPLGTTSMKGYLILKKDNPSGEAQFDNSLSIPITIL